MNLSLFQTVHRLCCLKWLILSSRILWCGPHLPLHPAALHLLISTNHLNFVELPMNFSRLLVCTCSPFSGGEAEICNKHHYSENILGSHSLCPSLIFFLQNIENVLIILHNVIASSWINFFLILHLSPKVLMFVKASLHAPSFKTKTVSFF